MDLYDPEANLIYHGTANPGPWNPDIRPGDNKWTCGIFARNPETGEARWFYQWSPHDVHDWDGINEQILLDLDLNGSKRKVLVRCERNGYVYVMDRLSGEVLSATPFVHITTTKGVDLKTGRLQFIAEKAPGTGRIVRDICPFAAGAKDWQPTAFSPKTGLVYIPHNNMCEDAEGTEVSYIAGTPYVGTMFACMRDREAIAGIHGVGSGCGKACLQDQREIPGVERNGRHGRRCHVLWNDGWLVQSDSRANRPGALAT